MLRTAFVFMLAALVSFVVMLITASETAVYVLTLCVIASYLCMRCEDVLYKRSLQRKRLQLIAQSAHSRRYYWM